MAEKTKSYLLLLEIAEDMKKNGFDVAISKDENVSRMRFHLDGKVGGLSISDSLYATWMRYYKDYGASTMIPNSKLSPVEQAEQVLAMSIKTRFSIPTKDYESFEEYLKLYYPNGSISKI